MDTLVSKDSLVRRHVVLDEEGVGLRSNIELAIESIPDKKVFGRRHKDRKCVEITLDLIQRLYAGEDPREDNTPAVNHILRVAHRIAVTWRVRDANVIMAALLHDAVEDHPEVLARRGKRQHKGRNDHDDAVDFVRSLYGGAVSRIVEKVSKKKNPKEMTPDAKVASYVAYAQGLARDPAALVVKIADVCDNISSPRPITNGGFYSMRKYYMVLPVLEAGLLRNQAYITKHCGEAAYLGMRDSISAAQIAAAGFLLNMPTQGG